MKLNKKICNQCGELNIIWKNDGGKRFCKRCWSAHSAKSKPNPTAKQKRLPQRSPKRIKLDKEYSASRKVFLSLKPMCEAHLPQVCSQVSSDVHHTYSGSNRSKYYLEEATWLAVCRSCHTWIHDNPKSAKELDLLK
tara:strand:- start:760 stop:1170 length:411 start_codon:yes stop_codon:yes gene_type:complete